MVAHELARRDSAKWKTRRGTKAETAEVRIGTQPVTLATTKVYMNQSGVSVRNLLADLRLKPDHLIVVHDELDLDLGRIRTKYGGGDNGHNGLKSIRSLVGRDYYRVRIGIGRPSGPVDVVDWVLRDFDRTERQELADILPRAADAVTCLITEGLEATQSKYNG